MPRTINLGLAKIPWGEKAIQKLLQKIQPFWKLLGAQGIWPSIIRVPITFPPQEFKNGTLLAGMCVSDLQGTQGCFSFYSTESRKGKHTGAQQYMIRFKDGVVESKLTGPIDGKNAMKCPFTARFDKESRKITFTVGADRATVDVG